MPRLPKSPTPNHFHTRHLKYRLPKKCNQQFPVFPISSPALQLSKNLLRSRPLPRCLVSREAPLLCQILRLYMLLHQYPLPVYRLIMVLLVPTSMSILPFLVFLSKILQIHYGTVRRLRTLKEIKICRSVNKLMLQPVLCLMVVGHLRLISQYCTYRLTVNNPSSFHAGASENQTQVESLTLPNDDDEDCQMDVSPPNNRSIPTGFNVSNPPVINNPVFGDAPSAPPTSTSFFAPSGNSSEFRSEGSQPFGQSFGQMSQSSFTAPGFFASGPSSNQHAPVPPPAFAGPSSFPSGVPFEAGTNQFNPNQFNPNQFNQFNPNQSNPTEFNQFNPNQSNPTEFNQFNHNQFNQPHSNTFNQLNPNQFNPNPTSFNQFNPTSFDQSNPTSFNQSNQFNPNPTSFNQFNQFNPNLTSFNQSNPNQFIQSNPNQFNQSTPNQLIQSTPNQFNQSTPNQFNQSTPNQFIQSTPNQFNQSTPNQFSQSTPNQFTQSTPNQSNPNQFNQSTPNQFNPSAPSSPFSTPVPNTSSASNPVVFTIGTAPAPQLNRHGRPIKKLPQRNRMRQ